MRTLASLCTLAAWLLWSLPAGAAAATDLTSLEQRWLQGAWPVLSWARQARLPLDVVVQPQPAPGMAPLALAFVDGRCKLVLSMRGNAEAQATLDRLQPDLRDAAIELMAAHELGHCRRWLDGAWQGVPAGFVDTASTPRSPELQAAHRAMRATRREEGYGDLVGLAWTQKQHAPLYARLHRWLVAERSHERIAGSHHDTLVWLRLAERGVDVAAASIFDAAARLWAVGLDAPD